MILFASRAFLGYGEGPSRTKIAARTPLTGPDGRNTLSTGEIRHERERDYSSLPPTFLSCKVLSLCVLRNVL